MEAIQLDTTLGRHPYACDALRVHPEPPRVGEATTLTLALKNPGPETITVNHIQFMVATFGIGVAWEKLPPIEQITLSANPRHVEEVAIQWTPTVGGHRCVRALIEADVLPRPIRIGRNLTVIESTAERRSWQVPFRLGNPENERMPITLDHGGSKADGIEALILVNGRLVGKGQPVWLNAKEEAEARMILHARTPEAIQAIKTVEAHIQGRFIDGIQVEVHRPAYLNWYPVREEALAMRPENEQESHLASQVMLSRR